MALRFDEEIVKYVNLYSRPALPVASSLRPNASCSFGVPDSWSVLTSNQLRELERFQGRSFLAALSHVSSGSGLTSHIVAEECMDDPSDDFRPGIPLWEIALDRARTTPGEGQLLAPPIEFGVAGAYSCYMPIGVHGDGPALHATVFVKGYRNAFPMILFTPWADAQETLPGLRAVLDSWHWG
jgi:hypothetical protein